RGNARMSSGLGRSRIAPAACALVLIAACGPVARAVGDFKIHLYLGDGIRANPAAVAAFERAAASWEAYIGNPIRINIEADLGTFEDPRIIGATNFGS